MVLEERSFNLLRMERIVSVSTQPEHSVLPSTDPSYLLAVLHSGANFSSVETIITPSITHLLLQNEIPLHSTISYLQLAKSGSTTITTVYNPSPMPSKVEMQAFPWELIDWLLLNEGEAKDIEQALESEPKSQLQEDYPICLDSNAPQPAKDALGVLNRLKQHPKFAKVNCICTLGALGVLVLQFTEGERLVSYYPSAPLLNPLKDTTGAGDCFTGYFAAGLMRTRVEGKVEMDGIIRECLTVSIIAPFCGFHE